MHTAINHVYHHPHPHSPLSPLTLSSQQLNASQPLRLMPTFYITFPPYSSPPPPSLPFHEEAFDSLDQANGTTITEDLQNSLNNINALHSGK